MCGIAGIIGSRNGRVIDAMVNAMHHRGPDDRGTHLTPNGGMGMTRLSIIDLSPAGHQPMSNEAGTVWIVFNGEIYNFRELRGELIRTGRTFKSSSDTEVILQLYEEVGDQCVERLRGMFAFAIFDNRVPNHERWIIARDHFGIKPLLYAQTADTFIFGSELKALLASGLVRKDIDPDALRQLLTFGSVQQPRTFIKDVRALPAAHRLIIENGTMRIERFWSLGVKRLSDLMTAPYDEAMDHMRRLLTDSVRRQMVSDVPLGAFLSGGIDSSLLVALMSHVAGAKIKTFSVSYGDSDPTMDESSDAERTARHLGTEHTRVKISSRDVVDHIHRFAGALDQPSVDGANAYFVSYAARQGVTVAISGTGGDELFAGYPWFLSMAQWARKKHNWKDLIKTVGKPLTHHSAFRRLAVGHLATVVEGLRADSGFLPYFARLYQIYSVAATARILAPSWRVRSAVGTEPALEITRNDELPTAGPVERTSGLCIRGYLQNQLLRDIDATSMAHSLEVRVPYLDPIVADAALSLPTHTKLGSIESREPWNVRYSDSGAKRILFDIGRPLLPSNIQEQKKRGFSLPFRTWLQGPLKELLEDTLTPTTVQRRGFFDPEEVERQKKNFLAGEGWSFVWLLMITELWCREVLDSVIYLND